MASWLRYGLTTLLAASLVATAACGDDDDDDGDDGDNGGSAQRVEVTLADFSVEMPDTAAAGQTTFVVTNSGKVAHNFEIEGEGLEEEFEADLQPGETQELTIDLEPGTYKVYCPVAGHEDAGMVTELVVK